MRSRQAITAMGIAALTLASTVALAAAPAKRRPGPATRAAPAGMVEKGPARPETRVAPPPTQEAVAPRGPTRLDFDDRLIQGQTNKSGAVYLFDRKELSVRSMVQQRSSFRDQIQKDVLSE